MKSPLEDVNPQFDATGNWIAYQSSESGRDEVYVRPFAPDAQATPISTNGGTEPRWRRDGKELFYLDADQRLVAVSITLSADHRIDIGTPRPVFQRQLGIGHGGREYVVSPDGKRFLIDSPVAGTPVPLTLIQNWKP